MSYKKIYEKLKEYEPKSLIRWDYRTPEGCCAIGALGEEIKFAGQHPVRDLCNTPEIRHVRRTYDCTQAELDQLQRVNDRLPFSNEDRYKTVLAWLKGQVEAEDA